jgi:hypothetical protein
VLAAIAALAALVAFAAVGPDVRLFDQGSQQAVLFLEQTGQGIKSVANALLNALYIRHGT